MPPMNSLTSGCMESILSGTDVDKPVVQILGSKKILVSEGTDRLRLLVSDGKHLNSFAMLATQLNHLHARGELEENTIVRLDRYTASVVSKTGKGDRRILVILELTILNPGAQVGRKIGNPVTYTGDSSSEANPNSDKQNAGVSTMTSRSTTNGSSYANCKPVSSYYETPSNSSRVANNAMLSTVGNMYTNTIASLSPYQTKWTIKARVIGKSGMRPWSNAEGDGKLFNMDLMDESGEIKATAYLEKYFDVIDFDKVYYFSKCQLMPANRQYSTLQNDYEIKLTNETVVQLCEDGDASIPEIKFNFVEIKNIANEDPKASIDVIGVCKESGEIQKFTGRTNNREFTKREVVLVDQSNASVSLTLWGDDAVNFDGSGNPVVLVKGARVTEFGGGKSLSVGAGSTLKVNPDVEKGHQLKGWYENVGRNTTQSNVSARTEWMTLRDAKLNNLGGTDKLNYFQVKAVIHIVRTANALYKSCPSAECLKKKLQEDNGQYHCEKCGKTFRNFKNAIRLEMSIADWASYRWVTVFNYAVEQMLGKTADDVGREIEQQGEQIFKSLHFKSFVFKLRVKMGTNKNMNQKELTVMSATPVNYKEYNKYLLKELEELTSIRKAT